MAGGRSIGLRGGGGVQHGGYVEALEQVAGGGYALGGEEAHDADGEVDGAEGADGFGGEGGIGGDVGGEAAEGGFELGARGGCDEGEEEEVG